MNQGYPLILGLMDTINDWNDKINKFAGSHMDNVWIGAACMAVIIIIAFWGVNTLNKR